MVIGQLGVNGPLVQRPAVVVTGEGAEHVPTQPLKMEAKPAKDPVIS